MYGTIVWSYLGSRRPSVSRSVVSAACIELSMESHVLLHAVARVGLGYNIDARHRRTKLYDLHMESEPSGITAYATLPRVAMLGYVSKLLHLAI